MELFIGLAVLLVLLCALVVNLAFLFAARAPEEETTSSRAPRRRAPRSP